jgi:hypothetical protein
VPEGAERVAREDIYGVYFHGPAYQVLDGVARNDGDAVGFVTGDLPLHHQPEGTRTVLMPRWIEACFQTAGVQAIGQSAVMALPARFSRVWWHGTAEPAGALRVVVTPRDEVVDADVVDERGRVLLHLEAYATVELPSPLSEAGVTPFRRVFGD